MERDTKHHLALGEGHIDLGCARTLTKGGDGQFMDAKNTQRLPGIAED